MAKTLTEQLALYPASGATLFGKGDPLHSRFMFDAARHLNNLWSYADVPVAFCLSPFGFIRSQMSTNGMSTELYVAQVPLLIQAGSKRLVWTLGGNIGATAGETTTISAFSIYLTSAPYTGAGSPSAFNVANLAPGYGVDTKTDSWSAASSVLPYTFVDRSSGGMTPIQGHGDNGHDRFGVLVLTATGAGSAVEGLNTNYLDVRDFTAWTLKE